MENRTGKDRRSGEERRLRASSLYDSFERRKRIRRSGEDRRKRNENLVAILDILSKK